MNAIWKNTTCFKERIKDYVEYHTKEAGSFYEFVL